MNKSKKGNKKIIIIGVVVIILVICVFLIFSNEKNQKNEVVNCHIETESLYLVNNITQRVKYIDNEFDSVEVEQKMKFKPKALKVSLEQLKDILDSGLKEKFNSLSNESDYSVSLEDGTIILKLNITSEDYKTISSSMNESDNILGSADNFYEDKVKFINQIVSQGGECTYE